jgi:hypothetical protein
MQTGPRTLGNHAYFFRDGTPFNVPAAGVASRTAKPGADDPGWIDLGVIGNLSITPESSEDEIFAPSPGTLELYEVIENKRKRTIKFDCEELSFLSFELALHTKPQSVAGGQYNPGSGKTVKGWLKVEQYDQSTDDDSDPTNEFDSYVHLKLDGDLKCDDNHVKTGIVAKCLRSNLNTGKLLVENFAS